MVLPSPHSIKPFSSRLFFHVSDCTIWGGIYNIPHNRRHRSRAPLRLRRCRCRRIACPYISITTAASSKEDTRLGVAVCAHVMIRKPRISCDARLDSSKRSGTAGSSLSKTRPSKNREDADTTVAPRNQVSSTEDIATESFGLCNLVLEPDRVTSSAS
jgi:hypothetical protein